MLPASELLLSHLNGQPDPLPALQAGEEQFYLNPNRWQSSPEAKHLLTEERIKVFRREQIAAAARLERFAPYFAAAYLETRDQSGLIESPLVELKKLSLYIKEASCYDFSGNLWLKQDSELPISGSIKARGGIYNVLCIVEEILKQEDLLSKLGSYADLTDDKYREIFSANKIVVSSTGNLGLSIGISAARFGFQVYVYMSRDARQWKKDLLRKVGAQVVEVEGDYGLAVELGRKFAAESDQSYFIDDERSEELFWGYSVAALRLEEQLKAANITVDAEHPLFVYLPCGVGGGPGGIAMGLELVFGQAAHCFFGEPVQVPCALLGFASGLYNKISTADLGLENNTVADGLAVARLSPLVGPRCHPIVSGCYTVKDQRDMDMLSLLWQEEQIFMEPSSQVATLGLMLFQQSAAWKPYLEHYDLVGKEDNITHLAWGTGGAMVPATDRESFLLEGRPGLTFKP
ncbi:MAG: D-serine ammonia-lyase [Eubacteriales bacterium]|nr:D-serine ammonia-lyase [Eubacteriales bacterium]